MLDPRQSGWPRPGPLRDTPLLEPALLAAAGHTGRNTTIRSLALRLCDTSWAAYSPPDEPHNYVPAKEPIAVYLGIPAA